MIKRNKSKSSKQYSTSSITKKHTRKSSKRNSSKILKYSIFSLNEAIFQSNNSMHKASKAKWAKFISIVHSLNQKITKQIKNKNYYC